MLFNQQIHKTDLRISTEFSLQTLIHCLTIHLSVYQHFGLIHSYIQTCGDTHIKVVNRFSDIELVHGRDDYGRSSKKKQYNKKKQINASPSKPPFQSTH